MGGFVSVFSFSGFFFFYLIFLGFGFYVLGFNSCSFVSDFFMCGIWGIGEVEKLRLKRFEVGGMGWDGLILILEYVFRQSDCLFSLKNF